MCSELFNFVCQIYSKQQHKTKYEEKKMRKEKTINKYKESTSKKRKIMRKKFQCESILYFVLLCRCIGKWTDARIPEPDFNVSN